MEKGRKRKFDAKQIQRMRDMKAEGLRNHEIARIMGVATGTVSAYLRGERGAIETESRMKPIKSEQSIREDGTPWSKIKAEA